MKELNVLEIVLYVLLSVGVVSYFVYNIVSLVVSIDELDDYESEEEINDICP